MLVSSDWSRKRLSESDKHPDEYTAVGKRWHIKDEGNLRMDKSDFKVQRGMTRYVLAAGKTDLSEDEIHQIGMCLVRKRDQKSPVISQRPEADGCVCDS